MKRTFCKGCVHLFYTDEPGFVPLCTLNARFIYGPLRSEIDVSRVASAEIVNHCNDCPDKSRFNLNSRHVQAFLLRRLNNGKSGTDKTKRAELTEELYSFKTERQNWITNREEYCAIPKAEIVTEEETSPKENVDDIRGDDNNIGTEASNN